MGLPVAVQSATYLTGGGADPPSAGVPDRECFFGLSSWAMPGPSGHGSRNEGTLGEPPGEQQPERHRGFGVAPEQQVKKSYEMARPSLQRHSPCIPEAVAMCPDISARKKPAKRKYLALVGRARYSSDSRLRSLRVLGLVSPNDPSNGYSFINVATAPHLGH